MKFQLCSDLHLEGSGMDMFLSPEADAYAFVGDIHAYPERALYFWMKVKEAAGDKPVLFVPGNHEYEGQDVEKAKALLQEVSQEAGVTLLDKGVYEWKAADETVKFYGLTLWSNFKSQGPAYQEEAKSAAKLFIGDFSTVFYQGRTISPDLLEKWHEDEVAWLSQALEAERNTPVKTVVLSHFAPFLGSLSPIFQKDLSSAFFVNDLEFQLGGKADVWCHGHTHSSFNYDCLGTRVYCNPRGHGRTFNLDPNLEFSREFLIEV